MISENISILRKEKGWTQAELARQLYKPEDAVQKWESGENTPTLRDFQRLAEIFSVPMDYLMKYRMVRNPVYNDEENLLLWQLRSGEMDGACYSMEAGLISTMGSKNSTLLRY